MISEEKLEKCANDSERKTALFFDSLGLECINLCFKIKADDESDITDLDGIFVDNENKVILIYDDSIQKADSTSKIALFFTKCSQTKYEKQIYDKHPELPHYPIKILYIDKSRSKKKENSMLGALEFILTDHTAILYKDDFEYFTDLVSQIGKWALNDLYNYLDIKLPNAHIEIDAIKIFIGNTAAYIFASKPHDVLKYAYVSRRRGNDKLKQSIFRYIYLDPVSRRVISLGHKEPCVFYREGINEDKKTVDERVNKYLSQIEKIKNKVENLLEELNEIIQHYYNNENDKEKKKEIIRIIPALLIHLRYLVKHYDFKEEQECRIIQVVPLINNSKIKVSHDYNRKYLEYLPFRKDSDCFLKNVFFGPKATNFELFKDRITQLNTNIICI